MYQDGVRNVLSPRNPVVSAEADEAMWNLFKAIGTVWQLGDDPAGYFFSLRAFMANRISLHPDYAGYYEVATRYITAQIAQHGEEAAYKKIFTTRTAPSGSELEVVKKQVSDEFIAWRLALGGFRVFGALNYRGHMGGANLPNEPVPYRTREPRHGP
jgi:hypothetical protein